MPLATRVGYRTETTDYVQFKWCPAGLACLSVVTVYKTDPTSWSMEPCMLADSVPDWTTQVANLDALEGVSWEQG